MADAHESNNARCARCGAAFHCGAQEAACDCAQVAIDAATREAIALRFSGCLCNECLTQLAGPQNAAAAAGSDCQVPGRGRCLTAR